VERPDVGECQRVLVGLDVHDRSACSWSSTCVNYECLWLGTLADRSRLALPTGLALIIVGTIDSIN
jgi:hypothetical protein